MTKFEMHGVKDPLAGKYNIVRQTNPDDIIKTVEVYSRIEFNTILEELNKYNINAPKEEKRILLRVE